MLTVDDYDDNDAGSTAKAEDFDCDGVLTPMIVMTPMKLYSCGIRW